MSLSTEDFTFIANFLRDRSAISIGPGKEYLVESRLVPLARSIGMPDLQSLTRELRRPGCAPLVKDRVVEAMTTNETSFFRDMHPFETLKNQVLPELIERRMTSRNLRIWSAASSTGQELYSIAMMLDADFPALRSWHVQLHGTDLSTEVIGRARAGRFSALEVNRGLPAAMLIRYLVRDGAEYLLDPDLVRRCTFQTMNLASAWPAQRQFDVIFCRNVLIYFELDVRLAILERLRRDLTPGGYLFLGAAETSSSPPSGLTAVRLGNTVTYRKDEV